MTAARRRKASASEKHAREITEAMAEAVQVRLLLTGFEAAIPASELLAFLSVKQRALDLEIRLRNLAARHPLRERMDSDKPAGTAPNVH